VNAPVDRMAAFFGMVRQLGAARAADADYRLYERLKREFIRDFPAATSAEYERAMGEISKAAGV